MKWKYSLLGILELFVALGAIPAGIMMILEPGGQGLEMNSNILAGSPFKSFLIPGIFLVCVHGLASLLGGIWTLRQHRYSVQVGVLLGIALIIWIVVQVYYIGLIHYFQYLFFLLGVIEIGLVLGITKEMRIKGID